MNEAVLRPVVTSVCTALTAIHTNLGYVRLSLSAFLRLSWRIQNGP